MNTKFDDNGITVEQTSSSPGYDQDPRFIQLSTEEQNAVRKYDVDKNGVLSFDEVMMLLQDFKTIQTKNANLKRALIFCSVLVVILSISNLGTAMAAAYLAKETKIGSNGEMVTMDGGGVSTVGRSSVEVSMAMDNLSRPRNYASRRLESEEGGGDVFIGCVSGDMLASIEASAQAGSTVMIFDEVLNGTTTYHQIIGDGMQTTSNTAAFRCSSMGSGTCITFVQDEEGACNDGRRLQLGVSPFFLTFFKDRRQY